MDTAFGTKILNRKDNSIGLFIKIWLNEYKNNIQPFTNFISEMVLEAQKEYLRIIERLS